MCQGSSAESDPSGAAGINPTTVKTCYYELLGVPRDATQDDIKKAYKKKALELHPDRNYNDTERATELFTEVQAVYEVISDPQERAWYDSHRDAILRNDGGNVGGGGAGGSGNAGGGVTNLTTTKDVMGWISLFGKKLSYDEKNPQSFYVVVGQAFAKLAEEEASAAEWGNVDPVYYPSFGGAGSEYGDWVKGFYSAWGKFSTAKSFSWCDVYRYSDAPDRKIKRLMEKDNKKLRDAAIREFNDVVRSFVRFVRKRDPRFISNAQREKQRQIEKQRQREKQRQAALLAASKEQAAHQRAENAAKLRNYKAADWTIVSDNVLDELYDYDTEPASGDEDEAAEDGEARGQQEEEEEKEEEEPSRYECIVCKKTFGSEGPMNAHERSKKHAKAVWELKKQMQKENKEFNLDRDVRGWKKPEEYKPIDGGGDDDKEDDYISSAEDGEDALSEAEARKEEPAAKPTEPKEEEEATRTSPAPSSEAEDEENDDYVSTATFSARLRGAESDLSNLALNNNSSGAESKPTAAKIGKAKAKKAKRAAAAAAAAASTGSDEEKANTCATCRQSFPSNTKMFNHLRDNPSHATPVPSAGGGGSARKKGKGKGK